MPLAISPLDPLIPIIVALLKQSGFPARWNALIAIAVYIVWTAVSLSFGLRAADGPITYELFVNSFVMSAVTGFVSYQMFWKQLGEQTLEQATSFVKGPVSEPVDTGVENPDEV